MRLAAAQEGKSEQPPLSRPNLPPRLCLSRSLARGGPTRLTDRFLVFLRFACNRHVVLPSDIAKALPKNGRLLTELEWRALGVQQSRGWIHYAIHKPEPHIMLFRRPLNYQQQQQQAARSTVAAR